MIWYLQFQFLANTVTQVYRKVYTQNRPRNHANPHPFPSQLRDIGPQSNTKNSNTKFLKTKWCSFQDIDIHTPPPHPHPPPPKKKELQNTWKWLSAEGEMLWKGFSSEVALRVLPRTYAKNLMWSNWKVLKKWKNIRKVSVWQVWKTF